MPHENSNGQIVDDYEGWLEITGARDCKETRGWYDCPEGDKYKYIQNNEEWWESDW